ncbi:hypothetical protein, partial [Falsiroseomonas oryzae]|uniref:hypothetical protein n=1 Tax=Falsiroseomonas oryzae TaxID=2766473 RepID=UPI0022EA7F16
MPVIGAQDAAMARRRPIVANGVPLHTASYIGLNWTARDGAPEPDPDALQPVAYLVEQPPHATVDAHFHRVNQFQVAVAGAGSIGRHPLAPVAVHFADAFSAYGPIRAGEHGLQYLTLRNGYDPGARYLPGARKELVANAKPRLESGLDLGQETVAPLPPLPGPDLASTERTAVAVLRNRPGGPAGWRHQLPAGADVTGPDPATGGGQFWVVVAGSLVLPGAAPLPPVSVVF